jgi:glutaredoxin 3
MKTVSIYSTPTCVYCNAAKDYFKANNVAYTEFNVASDLERRKEMIDKTGQMGVPVIMIGDEVVVGFDQDKVAELLAAK